MELVADEPPRLVDAPVVACYGHDSPGLGHPVEYVKVLGHTLEDPATCKYCGLRYCNADHH